MEGFYRQKARGTRKLKVDYLGEIYPFLEKGRGESYQADCLTSADQEIKISLLGEAETTVW